ncbi:hypothetical protein NG701_16525 [Pseudarthrobacter sp. HLT3-5]|uniref:hypothetical protein n=1 Tax=Pseudarthrobacter cellobiosi TaxID=2953654 RepID=UPI00208FC6B0|nr:hypothetical protein [Pseudarthrobacter sp. HLT3-5]MCO4276008.1 hypothetical protein [Pseudarthrobacter sp. HLT3-5]
MLQKKVASGAAATLSRVEWLIPEVVVQETVRHHNEAYEAAVKKTIPSLRRTERALVQLGLSVGLNAEELVRNSQIEHDYENKLRARIDEMAGVLSKDGQRRKSSR